jgi:hypothetical protein
MVGAGGPTGFVAAHDFISCVADRSIAIGDQESRKPRKRDKCENIEMIIQ